MSPKVVLKLKELSSVIQIMSIKLVVGSVTVGLNTLFIFTKRRSRVPAVEKLENGLFDKFKGKYPEIVCPVGSGALLVVL